MSQLYSKYTSDSVLNFSVAELHITDIYPFKTGERLPLPLYSMATSAGFPSPADDHMERSYDLNELLIKHPLATYLVRVSGNSMVGAGIHSGDLLIVDRSLEPIEGKIVIAALNGELTVKRLYKMQGVLHLLAENPDYDPIPVDPDSELQIWGVVVYAIHKPA
ncbi:MAG: translesion error-prone DNA polymerase V autoproteolytic subunit [Candidatus Caenarcaniphilales bacterium]|nr:translesion error-prone DNA polymerase V autoproteolytic subunit [Candidatus Caenarcaniphilales bacterium]